MNTITLIGVLMMSLASHASAADLEFKGLKPGIELADPDNRFLCKRATSPIADAVCYSIKGETIAGTKAEMLSVFLMDQKIASVSVVFKTVNFDTIKSALTEKYGPGATTHETLSNRMGATFENEIVKWIDGSTSMTLARYSGKIDTGLLEIHNAEAVHKFVERRRKQNTTNASDL